LRGREVVDLLLAHPDVRFAPSEFIALLKKLQPRLYSISSSPKAHTGQVHLTVSIVRYESLGRARKGVCSTFLAERVAAGAPVPVFIHSNKNFRPPADSATPMIMVGPGTGVAPFRGFLHERRALGASGRNWLLFGDQRAQSDFLYRDELESMHADGTLTRLDTAFSRDQAEKVYVQQRMVENAGELFAWLEEGAHFYVCGDASRMAKDVDAALHQVIEKAGGKSSDQAIEYVRRLKSDKRYQRDVY
jgi:sulfite reductase (NADPH) flavoprotein alpha-component